MDIFVRQLSLNAECFPPWRTRAFQQKLQIESFYPNMIFSSWEKMSTFKRRIPNEHFLN
jgi:hypothetical protein